MADALLTLEPVAADPLARSLPSRRAVLLEWMTGQPLVPPAVGLVVGIWLDACWHVPLLVSFVVFLLSAAVLVRFRRSDATRHVAVALAALAVGPALHDMDFRRWRADHIVRYTGREPVLVQVTGTVLAPPLIRQPNQGKINWIPQLPRTRLVLDAESLTGAAGPIRVSGLVAVTVREPVLHVRAGDRVTLPGWLYRPPPAANPGESDWALRDRRSGILVGLSSAHAAGVRVLPGRAGWPALVDQVRRKASAAMLEGAFPGEVPGSRLLEALVLGQRSSIDPELNQAFVNTGTVHYLSVSGAHVGMLASVVWLVGVALGASKRACAIWTMVLLTAYAALCEPNPPVFRSAIMGDLLCLAVLLRRPVRAANWLAASALVLLALEPGQLFNPGFQLSFLTLIGVIYLTPPVHRLGRRLLDWVLGRDDPLLSPEIQRRIKPPTSFWKLAHWFNSKVTYGIAVGIAAWAIGAPVSAYHFHQVSPWGWLNTLLLGIPVWLALVIGLAKTIIASVIPPLGWLLSWPLSGVTTGLVWMVQVLATLPGSGGLAPTPPARLIAVILAAYALWILRPWLRIPRPTLGLAFGAAATAALWGFAPPASSSVLRIHVLSVGDGTACVLQLPNGKTLLYDMGAHPPYDLARWTLGPLLAREHVYGIDALILSHPDLDHICGVPDLLATRSVRTAITTPYHAGLLSGPAERVEAAMRAKGVESIQASAGQRLSGTGDVQIEVLWPPPASEAPLLSSNDSSLVLRVGYAGRRVLLCGDIQDLPQGVLARAGHIRADVLLLPHHGSMTQNTSEFLRAVDPAWCIRSTGKPDSEMPPALRRAVAGRQYQSTAEGGAVEVRIGPGVLEVRPFRSGKGQ